MRSSDSVFHVLHLHEPMTRADHLPDDAHPVGVRSSRPSTSGGSAGCEADAALGAFCMARDRPPHRRVRTRKGIRIAGFTGDYEAMTAAARFPRRGASGGREHRVVLPPGDRSRAKALQVLLCAWPDIHRRSGLRLTVARRRPARGAPSAHVERSRDDGIGRGRGLGRADDYLLGAKTRPSRRRSARRASACRSRGRSRVDSGCRIGHSDGEVLTKKAAVSVPPDDPHALADAVCALVADEPRRERPWATRPARSPSSSTHGPLMAKRLEEAGRHGDCRCERLARHEDGAARVAVGLGALALAALVLAFVVIWLRGPGTVFDEFAFVIWSWIVLAFLLNVDVFRRLIMASDGSDALPPEHQPRLDHVLSSFGVGLLANAAGADARDVRPRRHAAALPDAPGTSAILVDCSPPVRSLHGRVGSATADALGGGLDHDRRCRIVLRPTLARGGTIGPSWERMGSLRRLVVMGRQGLSVLKAPIPLAGAIFLQVLAHAVLLRGHVAMQAFAGIRRPGADEHRERPRAGRGTSGSCRQPWRFRDHGFRTRSASRTASHCRRSRSRAA